MVSKAKKSANKNNWKKAQTVLVEQKKQRIATYKEDPSTCANCGKTLPYNKRKNKFCSNSCSASYNNTRRVVSEETKDKIRKSALSNKIEYKRYYIECKTCGEIFIETYAHHKRKYCSKECRVKSWQKHGRINGRKSVTLQAEMRRSKNEILFAELCVDKFIDVKTNEPMFNGWDADVIIEDLKVAVLWNGKWHYEKITENHSVEQVQNRDRIKVDEIKRAGYTPYIIKDMGSHDSNFVKEQFNIFTEIFVR